MSLPVLGQVVEERVELVDVCAAVAGRARLVDAHLVVAVRHRPDGRGGVAEARLAGARLLQVAQQAVQVLQRRHRKSSVAGTKLQIATKWEGSRNPAGN